MSCMKSIVCLANSVKVGGNCIAGRELLPNGQYGGWVRPVSARPTAEVSFMESLCEGNIDPQLLDILDIPLAKAAPHNHQTENYQIDTARPWVKRGRVEPDTLRRLCQHPTSLWMNTDRTVHGAFDCISREEAATFTKSLVLIQVPSLKVEVRMRAREGSRRKMYRAKFRYERVDYSLTLTDPVAINTFGRKVEGEYALTDSYLCISLTEPYAKDNNRCHKLVASIISNASS